LFHLQKALSQENKFSSWVDWLGRHPKDFFETFGLLSGTIVTAVMAGFTYRLYSLNKQTLDANTKQHNRNILGAIFEEGMLNVTKTMETFEKIRTAILTPGEFYPNEFAPKMEEALAQKAAAEKFGLRLDLYGVSAVSTEYKEWLITMIEVLSEVEEIRQNCAISSFGILYLTDSERGKRAPRFDSQINKLVAQKVKIMNQMKKLVAISI
jgi:hypothetical protein